MAVACLPLVNNVQVDEGCKGDKSEEADASKGSESSVSSSVDTAKSPTADDGESPAESPVVEEEAVQRRKVVAKWEVEWLLLRQDVTRSATEANEQEWRSTLAEQCARGLRPGAAQAPELPVAVEIPGWAMADHVRAIPSAEEVNRHFLLEEREEEWQTLLAHAMDVTEEEWRTQIRLEATTRMERLQSEFWEEIFAVVMKEEERTRAAQGQAILTLWERARQCWRCRPSTALSYSLQHSLSDPE